MRSKEIKAIIADADGTLVDTMHLISHGQYEAATRYLAHLGIPAEDIPDYDTYEPFLLRALGGATRHTLEQTVRLLYGQQHPEYLEEIDFDKMHVPLNSIQDEIAPEFVRPYNGLADFMRRVGEEGVKLAIFTSGAQHMVFRNFGLALPELGMTELYKDLGKTDAEKMRQFENTMREHFRLPGFTVVTCDDVAGHKPDPASLIEAMRRLEVPPEHSLVLGDHAVDMEAGVRAGVPNRVGITHGFGDESSLHEAGATRIVHSLADVLS